MKFNLFWFEIKKDRWLAYRWNGFSMFGNNNISVWLTTFYKLYRENADLRRCVEEKQETAWKGWYEIVTWYWKERKVSSQKALEDFLNNQKPFDEFCSTFIRDIEVAWNVFIEKVYNASGQLVWFDTLDPRTMSILSDKQGNVYRYLQRMNWDLVEFNPEDILHIKDKTDMDNEMYGLSKVETLVYDLMWDKEASISNYSFFQNNATPSSLIILENDLDEDEVRIAIENLKQQFAGGKNRHKMSVGWWIKDIKQIWTSAKDMEFYSYRKFNTERVCAVMWVPKSVLNYTEWVNYSNGDTQYKKFIENSIRPVERKLELAVTILLNEIAPQYRLEFIDDHINDLEDRVAVIERMIKNWLITINEGREKLDMELSKDENADKLLIWTWFQLLEDLDVVITQPNENNNEWV